MNEGSFYHCLLPLRKTDFLQHVAVNQGLSNPAESLCTTLWNAIPRLNHGVIEGALS